VDRPVIVASVATAVRDGALGLLASRRPGLVIVDECHHIAARSYQTILTGLGVFRDDGPLLLGVTATLGRADGLSLGETFDGPPSDVVPMEGLIRDGYLLRPRGIRVKVEGLDLSRIKRSRTSESGLDDKAVAQAMSDALAPAAIARAVLEHGKGRHAVAFLPSVELSKEQARVFAEHGLRSVHVDADTPAVVRKEIIRRARLGEYDVVCNVGLFTEGTDVPIWSLVILARPTSSEVLFHQMVVRGARPSPGQSDYVVLDVVGVTGRHRIRSVVDMEGVEMIDDLDDELKQFDEDDLAEPDEPLEGSAEPAAPGVDGDLVHEMIDLFSASHTAWQRSPRGVWYLPVDRSHAVFLAPADEVDRYDVFEIERPGDGVALLHEDPCDLAAAMAWGEKAARAMAKLDLAKGAEWRQEPVKLKRADRVAAIYNGAMPTELSSLGSLTDAQARTWAACNIDVLGCVARVTPEGYWTT
jgi:hypothetical protein